MDADSRKLGISGFARHSATGSKPGLPPTRRISVVVVGNEDFDVAALEQHLASMARKSASIASVTVEDVAPGRFGQTRHGRHQREGSKRNPITVLIASASIDLRLRLLARLVGERDIEVTDESVADAALLSSSLEAHRPRLLLLDKPLFDQLGAQSLRALQTKWPHLRSLLLVDAVAADTAEEVLRHRLHGFLCADGGGDECARAIRAVIRGELWLPRDLMAEAVFALLHGADRAEPAQPFEVSRIRAEENLTKREQEIVAFLRRGLTNKEIARHLGIMEDTVKKHLQSVFGKLGVRRRTLLLLGRAVDNGSH
jgi:DNA-binding NarL/FixJ family response regulator